MRRTATGVVAGNVYDKYGSNNPIARLFMDGFLRSATELFASCVARVVLEVGAGEGKLLAHLRPLKPAARFLGLELSPELAAEAQRAHGAGHWRRRLDDAPPTLSATGFLAGDAYALPLREVTADAVICCETLEHLDEPEEALGEIRRVLRPGGRALLSVPREPLWSALNLARGRYLGDLGNTPGHLQRFSRDGFIRLVGRAGLRVLATRAPLPWTLLLAER